MIPPMADSKGQSSVLIVDDEAGIRALLTDILMDLGYASVAVADGEAAIDELSRDRAAFQLAIVDFRLPGKSGLETLRVLRGLAPRLAGIISTGYEDTVRNDGQTLRETAAGEGYEILEKPYKIDELATIIERALRAQRVK